VAEERAADGSDYPQDRQDAQEAGEAEAALAEEAVLNAAVAFAGHVVTAAQQAAEKAGENVSPALQEAMYRQYLLETATLCLRRLGEAYARAADDPAQAALAGLLRDGAERARQVSATAEALGDLALDLLERLVAASREPPTGAG
jgi:hypothetical protein